MTVPSPSDTFCTRTVAGIVAVLQERYPGADLGADVHELIGEIAEQRLIILD